MAKDNTNDTKTGVITEKVNSSVSGETIDVSDYGIFSDAVSVTTAYNSKLEDINTSIESGKNKINDDSILMGPMKDNFMEVFSKIETANSGITTNFNSIGKYLTEASAAYQAGDKEAKNVILEIDGKPVGAGLSGTIQSSVSIPDNINQTGYTVTCYGEGGWYLGGGSKPTAVASGTNQDYVHKKWLASGAKYKNGIATMNVNGTECYLIATAPTFGKVGDAVNVNFKDGTSIPCVIADAKSTHDSNYTKYGHGRSNGSVNVLEFEVDRKDYNSKGNPNTSGWGLEWDSSSPVKSMDNYGSVI